MDEQILSTAVRVACREGYFGVTMEGVAAEAGVSKPTVYRRWAGRDELLVDALASALPDFHISDAETGLERLIDLTATFITDLVEVGIAGEVMALHLSARRDPAVEQLIQSRYFADRREAVEAVIRSGIADGSIDPTLSIATVRDLVFGPVIYRWLVVGATMTYREAHSLVAAAAVAVAAKPA